jgi:hypothetical protein
MMEKKEPGIVAEQELVIGPLPLKRSWFIDDWDPQYPRYHHIASLFDVMEAMTPEMVVKSLTLFLRHHDMLRARIYGTPGSWQQVVSDSEDVPIFWIDLSCLSPIEQDRFIKKASDDLHATLDPFAGSLIRVAYFEKKSSLPDQLLVIVHHSVTDGYSQFILYNDLDAICKLVKQGKEIELPAKTVSFKTWLEYLVQYVQEQLGQKQDWWNYYQSLPWQSLVPPPTDYPESDIWTTSDVCTSLSEKDLKALRRWLPILHMQLLEVFIAAFVQAYGRWTGVPILFLMLTDHGRAIFPALDVSRTVGVFAMSRWLFIDLRKCSSTREILLETKRQIREAPNRGFDLEMAFYHLEDIERVRDIYELFIQYQLQFNFISSSSGSLNTSTTPGDERMLRRAQNDVTPPEIAGTYTDKKPPLYCGCNMFHNEVRFLWKYDKKVYPQAIIEKIAQYHIESLQEFARASHQ